MAMLLKTVQNLPIMYENVARKHIEIMKKQLRKVNQGREKKNMVVNLK